MATRARQFDFLLAGLNDPDTGLALNAGTVEFYQVGTSTPKNVWTDADKNNAYTTYTLDTNGVAELYGDGYYKVVVKDSSGATEYTYDVIKTSSNEYILVTTSAASVTGTPEHDAIICNTGSNSITVNLQTVVNFNRPITIKKTSASNTVTIDPSGSQTIDGSATYQMTANGEVVTLIPDVSGATWFKTTHVATTISGLTATVSELNTACDGITATAAEINTVADGSTAKNSHTHTKANITDLTATAAEINYVCDAAADTSFSPGGTFISGTIYAAKVGRVVTLSWTTLTHGSFSNVSGAAGAVPAAYRPIQQARTLLYATSAFIAMVQVTTGGQIVSTYFDETLAAYNTTQTSSGCMSYVSAS